MPRKPVVINGTTYMKRTAALARLAYGWTLGQAFGVAPPPPFDRKESVQDRPITVGGVQCSKPCFLPRTLHSARQPVLRATVEQP